MLVFSRWGYDHNKLFADAPGLHHRVKTKTKIERKQAVLGIKMNKEKKYPDMTLKKKIRQTTKHKINPTPRPDLVK